MELSLQAMGRRATPESLEKGNALYSSAQCVLRTVNSRLVSGEVTDEDQRHYVVLSLSDGVEARPVCTCRSKESVCPHAWAIALVAQNGEPATPAAPAIGFAERRNDGRRFLDALGSFPQQPAPAEGEPADTLTFQVDLEASRESNAWVLRAKARRPDSSATGTPIAIHRARLTEEDRAWLDDLEDHLEPGDGPGDHRIVLPPDRAHTVLARLGEEDRLRLPGPAGPKPLGWDKCPPFAAHFKILPRTERSVTVQVEMRSMEDGGAPLDIERVAFSSGRVGLLDDDQLIAFAAPKIGEFLQKHREPGDLTLDLEEANEFLERTAQIGQLGEVELPDNWATCRKPTGCEVRIPEMDALQSGRTLRADVHAMYGERAFVIPPESDEFVLSSKGPIHRNSAAEKAYVQRFLDCGGQIVHRDSRFPECRVPLKEFQSLVSDLLDGGFKVFAEHKPVKKAEGASMRITSGIDWFDLDGEVRFGSEELSLPAILAGRRPTDSWVRLGDGSLGLLPENWLERMGLIGEAAGPSGEDTLRLSRSQALVLDALLDEHDQLGGDTDFEQWRKGVKGARDPKARRERKRFEGELRPYQREGIGWLHHLRAMGLGGCLADDMGLGKTVQVLAHLDHILTEKGVERRPSLVVCPRSLLFNWRTEAERFTPHIRTHTHWGPDRKRDPSTFDPKNADLFFTTYQTLRRDIEFLKDVPFDLVVLDEAQAIKNEQSQAAKATRLLHGQQRIALSGTPIENHLGELWSLSEFLNRGMLGRSGHFQKAMTADDPSARETLGRAMSPLFLRRTKEQVATDLPAKSEQVIWCDLDDESRARYDEVADFYRASLLEGREETELRGMKIQVLEALLRLRQIACHPGLVDASLKSANSAKIDTLMDRLEEVLATGHKALIFSQFTKLLAIVRDRLEARGIDYEYLDGRTRKREEKVARFQEDPNLPLFLISLKAGGTGLNLTAADYVFVLDPWWNPAVEAQAIDRAHRIGRTKPVTAYRLIARDTVEEKVLDLQNVKRELAREIFPDEGTILRALTTEDLDLLLTGS